jgi:short-subunit dehydrogenase
MIKNFRCIVITGASSGIGEALALDYAAPDATLGLIGRDATRLARVADACRAKGAAVAADAIDCTDRAAMAGWLSDFDDAQPVDLAIASAGISIDQDNPGLEPFDVARRTMLVNFEGMLNTVEPLVGRMMRRRKGQLGLLSSQAGFFGRPYSASYNASKAAVRVWGESIRYPLRAHDVGVTVILPGFVESRMSAATARPKPFIMTAPAASRVIRHGLARNAPRVAFPMPITASVWFTALLPAGWSARLLQP